MDFVLHRGGNVKEQKFNYRPLFTLVSDAKKKEQQNIFTIDLLGLQAKKKI